MFGKWRSVSGTVIHVDPPYTCEGDGFRWIGCLVALLLLPPVIFAVLPFVIAGIIMSAMLSVVGIKIGRSYLLSHLTSQLLGYLLVGKLFGPKKQVPVRDFRVRDAMGSEHLVRIRGELVSGTVTVGDTVQVAGYDNGGTLMLENGMNTRLGSQIRVRRL